ncbi:hypothetical protein TIFTF001_039659 [Ficus carica]|uniref:Condensin complex subunit 2 n=1 Tax=Ficus carica TaxID=3494 RepID=A0AA88E9J9_FICCA|nr:hypothetical protein TIFTF001_039659 [Ficus carica]
MQKINQKNTWELKLIDHLSVIVNAESENKNETNFEKASCTLEASAKIYSLRIDSLHSESYKVLSGIFRVGLEDEQETFTDDDNVNGSKPRSLSKEESEKKVSPLATLESSFKALNVKKFDVDPLYHRISAQIDEGGAKGKNDISASIDLSFSEESIKKMVMNVSTEGEICPTLGEIICLFDEDNQHSRQAFNVGLFADSSFHDNEVYQDNPSENHGACSKKNALAGPDHWKYQTLKEDISTSESRTKLNSKRSKKKKETEADLEYTAFIGKEMTDILAPPRNPKSLLLSVNRSRCSNSLPEDCHYELENLDSEDQISFKHLLATFHVDSRQDAAPEDLSPHLLFVCLLHLATEHGLIVQDYPSLDDLSICLPSCENIRVL